MTFLKKLSRHVIVLSVLLSTCGCAYYNKYVKQKFPISKDDKVTTLVAKQEILSLQKVELTQALYNQPKNSKYRVGSPLNTIGYNSVQPIVLEDAIIIMDSLGYIYSLNKHNPKIKNWQSRAFKTNRVINGAIILNHNSIFTNNGSNIVKALDINDGKILWETTILGSIRGRILSDKKSIFIFTNDNKIYAIDQVTGRILWSTKPLLIPFKLISSPKASIIDGKIIITLPNNSLAIYNKNNGFLLKQIIVQKLTQNNGEYISDITINPMSFGNNSNILISVYNKSTLLIDLNGNIIWDIPIYTTNNPVIDGNLLYLIDSNNTLYLINIESGTVIWKRIIELPEKFNLSSITGAGDRFYGLISIGGDIILITRSGHLIAVDKKTGVETNRIKITPGAQNQPIFNNGNLYIYIPKKSILEILRYEN